MTAELLALLNHYAHIVDKGIVPKEKYGRKTIHGTME